LNDVLRGRLLRKYRFAPRSARTALHAMDALLNYDMQAIIDAFIFDFTSRT
jgi:hypothetical protein